LVRDSAADHCIPNVPVDNDHGKISFLKQFTEDGWKAEEEAGNGGRERKRVSSKYEARWQLCRH
jgi:hypothetical protein